MNWQDFKHGDFSWSIGEGGGKTALLMGPLPDGRIVVHAGEGDPTSTFRPIDGAKDLAAELLGVTPDTEAAPPPEGEAEAAEAAGDTTRKRK